MIHFFLYYHLLLKVCSMAILNDGVTEFYDTVNSPVHMIVSGSVLVTDEPQSRSTRSHIPYAPIMHQYSPDIEQGISYIYDRTNMDDQAVYSFPRSPVEHKNFKRRFNSKRKHPHRTTKHTKRRHHRNKNKAVVGRVRDQIPAEKHVQGSRKTLYPPPSNMWLINQELAETEDALRKDGRLQGLAPSSTLESNMETTEGIQDYLVSNLATDSYPHPEIENVDATTNFGTKEVVPKTHSDANVYQDLQVEYVSSPPSSSSSVSFSPRSHHKKYPSPRIHVENMEADDHETAAMFNKGHTLFKKPLFKPENSQNNQPEGTKEYQEKIHEIQGHVDQLKANADDNKVEEIHITHDGTHTVSGNTPGGGDHQQIKPLNHSQKSGVADGSSLPVKTSSKGIESVKNQKQQFFNQSEGEEGPNDESSYADSFQEKFLKLYSPDALEQTTDLTEENNKPVSEESSVKEGGILLNGEEPGNHFKPHIKTLVLQTKVNNADLENAAANGIPVEQVKSEMKPSQQSASSSEDEVENPAGYSPKQDEKESQIGQSRPGKLKSSSPLSAVHLMTSEPSSSSTNRIEKLKSPSTFSKRPTIQKSFKELLTKQIQENLYKINPKAAPNKAKELAVEAISEPIHKSPSFKSHGVVYPHPAFRILKVEKKPEEESENAPYTDKNDNPVAESHKVINMNSNPNDNPVVSQPSPIMNAKTEMHDSSPLETETDDKIDGKTEKPVSARKDPDENQMTITADPSQEDASYQYDADENDKADNKEQHSDKIEHNLIFSNNNEKQEDQTKKPDVISNKNLVNKQRAMEYLLHKNAWKQKYFSKAEVAAHSTTMPAAPSISDTQPLAPDMNTDTIDEQNQASVANGLQAAQTYTPLTEGINDAPNLPETQEKNLSEAQSENISNNPSLLDSSNPSLQAEQAETNAMQSQLPEQQSADSSQLQSTRSEPASFVDSKPVDIALTGNMVASSGPNEENMGGSVPEISITAPQDNTAKSVEDSNISRDISENEHKETSTIVSSLREPLPYNLESSVNPSSTLTTKLSTATIDDVWPAGVNPGALLSFQMVNNQDQHEKGKSRMNVKEQHLSEGKDKLNFMSHDQPVGFSAQPIKNLQNIMSLLKPRHSTGPSIAYDQVLPGITVARGISVSTKSKSKSKASANSAASSSSSSNAAAAANGKAIKGQTQAATGVTPPSIVSAKTRHHEKKPGPNYGYGAGSGYGYGTKSWGWGGGGGWAGQSPPKGMPLPNYPSNPPPNIPGFPNGNANTAPPYPGQVGAQHTPQGTNPPISTQNHQSSVATGPNSVPPSFAQAKKPFPLKLTSKQKEKFGKPKFDKVKTETYRVMQLKNERMKKLQKQNTYEKMKQVQQVTTIKKPVQQVSKQNVNIANRLKRPQGPKSR